MKKLLLPLIGLSLLTGCQSDTVIDDLLAGKQVDYKQNTDDQKSLQYPPDLIAAGTSVEGTVSLTQYTIESVPNIEDEEVAVEVAEAVNVIYRRDGRIRWVQAGLDANALWPRALAFWTKELGFALERTEPNLGIIETEWLDLRRAATAAPGLRAYLDDLIGLVRDSGERDRFLTRLERNADGGTDLYITHRRLAAKFARDGGFSGYEAAPNENQLEIEMLRRMMLYLGRRSLDTETGETADESEVNEQINEIEGQENKSDYGLLATELVIKKPFLESWQLVQIGLSRGDFSIEDRDYQDGIIFIQHSGGPESEEVFGNKAATIFSKLFGNDKPVLRTLKLVLGKEGDTTRITVEADEDDTPLSEKQMTFVLALLYEWLP